MSATAYRIEARRRSDPLATASIDDFLLVQDGEGIAIDTLLVAPHVTPYCIDLFGSRPLHISMVACLSCVTCRHLERPGRKAVEH
jgi:hypothetical protein